jgi:diguanylate cyclase (GGDEF)-like protein
MDDKLKDALLTSMDDGGYWLALFDPQDRLVYANASFRNALNIVAGSTPGWEQIMRQCHASGRGLVIDTGDIDQWCVTVNARRHQQAVRSFESDLTDGRWFWVTEMLRADGSISLIGSDISAMKSNESALRHSRDLAVKAAETDPLTGLYNRRFIQTRLGEAVTFAHRYLQPFCISVLDLDHFKQINDSFGHPVGDRVLQHFASQAQAHLRPHDLLARIGGEEFMLLLPATSAEDADGTVERIRQVLRQSLPLPEHADFHYTFSAGIASLRPADTADSLFLRADRALYGAKQQGRNCQVMAGA